MSRQPRAPLFPLVDIAERLGLTMQVLRALMRNYPLRRPRSQLDSRSAATHGSPVGMYRVADFKQWIASNEIILEKYAT